MGEARLASEVDTSGLSSKSPYKGPCRTPSTPPPPASAQPLTYGYLFIACLLTRMRIREEGVVSVCFHCWSHSIYDSAWHRVD